MTQTASARRWKIYVAAYLFTIACCDIFMLVKATPKLRQGYQDFVIYYGSGQTVREGRSAMLYDFADQYRTQLTFAGNVPIRHFALPYNHPPFEAVFFVPFALLGFWPAYLVWTALNASMLTAMAILLRRYPAIRNIPPVLMAAAVLSYFPVINGLLQGQDVILLAFFAVMALMCLERNSDVMAGACVGACLFRPHLAAPLVLLLAVRRWRVLLGFIPVGLLLMAVSVYLDGVGMAAGLSPVCIARREAPRRLLRSPRGAELARNDWTGIGSFPAPGSRGGHCCWRRLWYLPGRRGASAPGKTRWSTSFASRALRPSWYAFTRFPTTSRCCFRWFSFCWDPRSWRKAAVFPRWSGGRFYSSCS